MKQGGQLEPSGAVVNGRASERAVTRAIYESHVARRARMIPLGIAIILLGIAAGDFLTLVPISTSPDLVEVADGLSRLVGVLTKELVKLDPGRAHALAFIVRVAGILSGVGVLTVCSHDREAFQQVFPHIDQFYTAGERRAARRYAARLTVAAVIVAVLGVLAVSALGAPWPDAARSGSYLAVSAAAAVLFAHGRVVGNGVDLFAYNFEALRRENIYRLEKDDGGTGESPALREKRIRDAAARASELVMVVAIILALSLYFLPTMETPLYWVPIVAAFLVHGALDALAVAYAKRTCEPDFDRA